MTRMTGPDCVVMCNLINKHTHTHTHTHNDELVEDLAAFATLVFSSRVLPQVF